MDSCINFIFSEWTWTFLTVICIYFFYNWATCNYDFFKLRNIPYVKPIPLFGNLAGRMFFQESFFEFVLKTYNQFEGQRLYGTFELKNPELYIRDPELIKLVLVKHFDHFVNRRTPFDEKDDPLLANGVFFLKDDKWKDMRATLSPLYTRSKLSKMFELITEICQDAIEHIKTEVKNDQADIELKSFFTRYANDAIYTTAFGLKIDSFLKKDNEYVRNGCSVTSLNFWFTLKVYLFYNYNKVMKFFNIRLFGQKITSYYRNLVLDAIKYRSDHNIFRHDLIHILMESRKGIIKIEKEDEIYGNSEVKTNEEANKSVRYEAKNRKWSDDELVAQSFIFFLAGFHSILNLLCFCAIELVENPNVKEKLVAEIDDVKNELNGKKLTYGKLSGMKYLDQFISEILRKWPPGESTSRECVKPYVIHDEKNDQEICIEPGLILTVPIAGLHRDPKYFPEPEKFDPERFNEENKKKIIPFTYLPFGNGPRYCIGSKLALMESKAILFYILSEFTLEKTSKTTIPIKLSPRLIGMQSFNEFWIGFKSRI